MVALVEGLPADHAFVASGERVKRFARNEFLGDLSFEFDAMGTVPGHGFHPLKARQSWSIPNLQDVHR
jgi:hypothetical protein